MADKTMNPPVQTVTADDVAAEAGVSRWTVNRAFRQNASISEESRKRVTEAAEKLGYVPDLAASSLRSNNSRIVSLLIDDFANPHKLVMLERLTKALRKAGWDTFLVNMLDEDDAPGALLSASQRRVDAAVVIGSRFNEEVLETALGAKRVRKLVTFARMSRNPKAVSICCDDEAAMREIADYVLKKKFSRPMFLAGPQSDSAHLLRKETFMAEWERKTGNRPEVATAGVYDAKQSFVTVASALSNRPASELPDVIVCENDALAIGAIDAIKHQLGLSIPKDIAVTGFDDIPAADSPNYQLTTYRQPMSDMAESLVAFLRDETDGTGLNRFEGKLIVRKSA
ncbi:LacI family DNA-binding transcriptional regulator [Roseibium sp. SCPC15]|uniref:LacI family DNA-binding transcriptional regulator n=1 Tax=Roseibium sp. SCP15 TaxID=3141376 RepID=UPI00333AEFA7